MTASDRLREYVAAHIAYEQTVCDFADKATMDAAGERFRAAARALRPTDTDADRIPEGVIIPAWEIPALLSSDIDPVPE